VDIFLSFSQAHEIGWLAFCCVAVGHHTQLTNPGYSRKKVDGTMFFSWEC